MLASTVRLNDTGQVVKQKVYASQTTNPVNEFKRGGTQSEQPNHHNDFAAIDTGAQDLRTLKTARRVVPSCSFNKLWNHIDALVTLRSVPIVQ